MVMQFFKEPSFGDDPPSGTSLHYWQLNEIEDSVSLVIANEAGKVVRTLKHKGKPGINRVWWDFKEDPTTKLKLRTKPIYAPWYPLDDNRQRKSLVAPLSLMASPGNYSVTLKTGDFEQTQSFQVVKDPNTEGTLNDIAQQKELLDKIRVDFEEMSLIVNEAERLRRQLKDLAPMVSDDMSSKILAVDSMVTAVENQLIQLKHTGKGQDAIRLPGMLLEKLNYLAGTIAIADFKPADQYVEVYEKLHSEWLEVQKAWQNVLENDVASLENAMKENQVGPLIIGMD